MALSEEPPLFDRFTSRIEPLLPIGGELDGVDLIPNFKIFAVAGDITQCYAVCSLFKQFSPVPCVANANRVDWHGFFISKLLLRNVWRIRNLEHCAGIV